jgi:hypothetical protein
MPMGINEFLDIYIIERNNIDFVEKHLQGLKKFDFKIIKYKQNTELLSSYRIGSTVRWVRSDKN